MLSNELEEMLDIPARVLAALGQQVQMQGPDTTSGITNVQAGFARSQWLNKKTATQPAMGEADILKEMLQLKAQPAFKERGWFLDSLKNDLFECNEVRAL